MAERGGFEPPRRLHACWFSRPVHSTTLPPLRDARDHTEKYSLCQLFSHLDFKTIFFGSICEKFCISIAFSYIPFCYFFSWKNKIVIVNNILTIFLRKKLELARSLHILTCSCGVALRRQFQENRAATGPSDSPNVSVRFLNWKETRQHPTGCFLLLSNI